MVIYHVYNNQVKEVALMAKDIETTGDPTSQPADQEKLEPSELVPADELTALVEEMMAKCADAGYAKSVDEEGQNLTTATLGGVLAGREVWFAISQEGNGDVSVMFTDRDTTYLHYTVGVNEADERVVVCRDVGGAEEDFQPIARGAMDALRGVASGATPLSPQM